MSKYTKKEKESSAQYVKEFLPAIIAYMLLIFATKFILKGEIGDSDWAYLIALLPMVPTYFVMRAIVRFVNRSDEFFKKIFLESGAVTLLIITFLGFSIGLVQYVGGPDIDLFIATTMICPIYFIVVAYLFRKNGADKCQ